MPTLKTFLTFNDKAEEAANLYVSLFPESRITSTARYGDAGPGKKGSVMTVAFELMGQPFVALNGGPSFTFSQGFSLAVLCDTQDEIDRYWNALSEGGAPNVCGWLTDRFGVSWQITPKVLPEMLSDKDAVRSQRAMKAMMGMKKLDIAGLKRAFEG